MTNFESLKFRHNRLIHNANLAVLSILRFLSYVAQLRNSGQSIINVQYQDITLIFETPDKLRTSSDTGYQNSGHSTARLLPHD
jgi:hypothetical protein